MRDQRLVLPQRASQSQKVPSSVDGNRVGKSPFHAEGIRRPWASAAFLMSGSGTEDLGLTKSVRGQSWLCTSLSDPFMCWKVPDGTILYPEAMEEGRGWSTVVGRGIRKGTWRLVELITCHIPSLPV